MTNIGTFHPCFIPAIDIESEINNNLERKTSTVRSKFPNNMEESETMAYKFEMDEPHDTFDLLEKPLKEAHSTTTSNINGKNEKDFFSSEDENKQTDTIVAIEIDPLLELNTVPICPYEFTLHDVEHDENSGEEMMASQQQQPQSLGIQKKRGSVGRPKKKMPRIELMGGRYGLTWSTTPHIEGKVLLDRALPNNQVKGKGPAQLLRNPLEAWHLLIDEPIIQQMVYHINQSRLYKRKSAHESHTDVIEFRAWLGLNYLLGVLRNASEDCRPPLEELWTVELGNVVFRATMTFKRYEYLSQCMAEIDDKQKGIMQSLWEKFLINCRSYYFPSDFCNINEYADFRAGEDGRLASKGFVLLTLSDAQTLYVCNALVVTREASTDASIIRLVADLKGTNRCLALPETFISIPLAQNLHAKQFAVLGVTKKDATATPEIPDFDVRKIYCDGLTIEKFPGNPERDDNELYLLTSQLPTSISAAKLENCVASSRKRLSAVTRSFSTKNAKKENMNSCWTLDLLYTMLDFAVLNACVLLRLSSADATLITPRDFQRQLGLFLVQKQLKRRLHNKSSTLPLVPKLQLCEILGVSTDSLLSEATNKATRATTVSMIPAKNVSVPEDVLLVSRTLDKRSNCKKCKARCLKTRLRCQQCGRALCYRHLIQRCDDCTGMEAFAES